MDFRDDLAEQLERAAADLNAKAKRLHIAGRLFFASAAAYVVAAVLLLTSTWQAWASAIVIGLLCYAIGKRVARG